MNLLGTIFVYVGLIASFLGFVSLVKPLTFLGGGSRLRAMGVLLAGVTLVATGMSLPAQEQHVRSAKTKLDEFVPVWQFNELHSILVRAPPDRVFQAIKDVSADEISLFRTLTWIRRFGRPGPASILNLPENKPLLEVATRTAFLVLAEEPNREIVVGTLVVAPRGWRPKEKPTPEGFKALRTPGFAPAATNFRIEDTGMGDTLVTTETRVYATDKLTRRRFAAYWRVIYPGSSLIRVMWLRAIKKRAEKM